MEEMLLSIDTKYLVYGALILFVVALWLMSVSSYGSNLSDSNDLNGIIIILTIGAYLMICATFASILLKHNYKIDMKYEEAQSYVTEGYAITVNGQIISQLPESLDAYDINYDHESKTVVLIRK